MKPSYYIVTSCDNGFAQHTSVMLASLFSHHPNHRFQVFVLAPMQFSSENVSKILGSATDKSSINVVQAPDDALGELKIDGHITSVTYFRLRIEQLLPAKVKRVLYLDSDIIIRGDISELLDIDLLGFPFGAVPDVLQDKDKRIRAKIGLNPTARYFNAGVLVIDLPRWRADRIGGRAIEYCRTSRDSITWWDQCALNHVVNGQFYILDEKWNAQSDSSKSQLRSAPIIHFTGPFKPWHFRCVHPSKHLYFEFLKKTAWADFKVRWTYRDLILRVIGPEIPRAAVGAGHRTGVWLGRWRRTITRLIVS